MALSPKLIVISSLSLLTALCCAQKQLVQVSGAGAVGPLCPVVECKLSTAFGVLYHHPQGIYAYKRKDGTFTSADFNFRCAPGQDEDCDDLVDELMNSILDRKSISVIFMDDPVTKAASKYFLTGCFPTQWTSPPCDITLTTKPGYEQMTFTSTETVQRTPIIYPKTSTIAKQKAWLCSNFRCSIDGVDSSVTNRVAKIDSMTIKQGIADLDGDGLLDFTVSDLVMEVPVDNLDAFRTWQALAGDRQCVIDYLDTDGTTIRSLVCTSVCPIEITERSPTTYTVRCAVTGRLKWQVINLK